MANLFRKKIKFSQYKNIVILTGAGISVASGLKTYRGQNSDPNNNSSDRGHIDRFRENPLITWELFNSLRRDCLSAKPNLAHQILAELECRLKPEQNFTLITQNVDRLHHQAGSKNVIELHGTISETCCSNKQCQSAPFSDRKQYIDKAPLYFQCNYPLKPNVVLFGEQIPLAKEWQVKQALRNCDLFIAVGTSGTVFPAANYVRSAEYIGAKTILINLEPTTPKNPYFQQEFIGKAENLLPQLFDINF